MTRYYYILLIIASLLIAGCTGSDDDNRAPQYSTMEIIPVSASFRDVTQWTRADEHLPSGYVWYNELSSATNPEYANIGMFMTPERTTPFTDYIYQDTDDSWKSTIIVESGKTYYMYGFMPRQAANDATILPLNESYANGATLHLDNFQTLTPADVCVVVGVRKATEEERTEHVHKENVNLGTFSYEGGAENENAAFVLLKHIYSGMQFKAIIDPTYHKLREIKFTKVELIAKNMAPTVDIDVTITANNTGTDPLTSIDFSVETTTVENNTITLFPWEGSATEYQLKESEPQMFLGCFTPGTCTNFVIRTTYNVYDKKGKKIREGCVAENTINETIVPGLAEIDAGEVYTITCTVKPTYLYVLSDPDLNNPTITLSAE